MGRYTYPAFRPSATARFIVIWSMHWRVIECERLAAGADLEAAMAAAIARLAAEGWEAEGNVEFGFTFIRNRDERRLLTITEQDPARAEPQSFSPFR